MAYTERANMDFIFQLSEEYDVDPWKKIFKSYHNCTEEAAVIHGNGDSLVNTYKKKWRGHWQGNNICASCSEVTWILRIPLLAIFYFFPYCTCLADIFWKKWSGSRLGNEHVCNPLRICGNFESAFIAYFPLFPITFTSQTFCRRNEEELDIGMNIFPATQNLREFWEYFHWIFSTFSITLASQTFCGRNEVEVDWGMNMCVSCSGFAWILRILSLAIFHFSITLASQTFLKEMKRN